MHAVCLYKIFNMYMYKLRSYFHNCRAFSINLRIIANQFVLVCNLLVKELEIARLHNYY